MFILTATAMAASLSGLGVPEPLGAFGGPTSHDARGLPYTPVAALPDATSASLDVGVLATRYSYTLDGKDTVTTEGASPVPSVAAAVSRDRFGFGGAFFVPFARNDAIRVVEFDFAGAMRPVGSLTVGAALRVCPTSLISERSVDTGATLYAMLGEEAGVPLGDPFLAGTQKLGLSDLTFGGAFGVRFAPTPGPQVDVAFRTPLAARLQGPITYIPSNDLSMIIEGTGDVVLALPAELTLAAETPFGPIKLGTELGWTGWSSMTVIETTVTDFAITSPDELMQAYLEGFGLTEAEFLQGAGRIRSETGMSDVLTVAAWTDFPVGRHGGARIGSWYSTAAVPSDHVHPLNVDFGSLDVRLAAGRWFGPVELALSFDGFVSARRNVTESVLGLTAGPGRAVPSPLGTYSLEAARLGFTATAGKEPS